MLYPSLVEVDRSGIGLDPSSVEVIVFVVLATGLIPLRQRWIVVVLPRWHCKVERGVRYSLVVKILLGGGSLGGSPRWTR